MISDVFNAVKTQLETTMLALGLAAPAHELGAFNLASTSAPPQIVWEIHGGEVTAARQNGDDGTLGIRELARRNERISVHVWGDSFDETEKLMNHFVAAARTVATGFSFAAKSTNWMPGQDQRTAKGRVCILEIEIGVPFTAEPLGISQPPHTATVQPVMHAPA